MIRVFVVTLLGGCLVLAAGAQVAAAGPSGCTLADFVPSNADPSGDSTGLAVVFLLTVSTGGTSVYASAEASGTSGCGDAAGDENGRDVAFVAATRALLSLDVARGNGPYLSALGALLGCSAADRADFASRLRRDYAVLFPAVPDAPAVLLARLRARSPGRCRAVPGRMKAAVPG